MVCWSAPVGLPLRCIFITRLVAGISIGYIIYSIESCRLKRNVQLGVELGPTYSRYQQETCLLQYANHIPEDTAYVAISARKRGCPRSLSHHFDGGLAIYLFPDRFATSFLRSYRLGYFMCVRFIVLPATETRAFCTLKHNLKAR